MHIPVSCRCGASLKAPPELLGKTVRCPNCSAPLVVTPPLPILEPEDEKERWRGPPPPVPRQPMPQAAAKRAPDSRRPFNIRGLVIGGAASLAVIVILGFLSAALAWRMGAVDSVRARFAQWRDGQSSPTPATPVAANQEKDAEQWPSDAPKTPVPSGEWDGPPSGEPAQDPWPPPTDETPLPPDDFDATTPPFDPLPPADPPPELAAAWRTDHAVFVRHLRQAAADLKAAGEDPYLALDDIYAGRSVTWTLPFEGIDAVSDACRFDVRFGEFYPALDTERWERIPRGALVTFRGVISYIELDEATETYYAAVEELFPLDVAPRPGLGAARLDNADPLAHLPLSTHVRALIRPADIVRSGFVRGLPPDDRAIVDGAMESMRQESGFALDDIDLIVWTVSETGHLLVLRFADPATRGRWEGNVFAVPDCEYRDCTFHQLQNEEMFYALAGDRAVLFSDSRTGLRDTIDRMSGDAPGSAWRNESPAVLEVRDLARALELLAALDPPPEFAALPEFLAGLTSLTVTITFNPDLDARFDAAAESEYQALLAAERLNSALSALRALEPPTESTWFSQLLEARFTAEGTAVLARLHVE